MKSGLITVKKALNLLLSVLGFRIDVSRVKRQSFVSIAKTVGLQVWLEAINKRRPPGLESQIYKTLKNLPRDKLHIIAVLGESSSPRWIIETRKLDFQNDVLQFDLNSFSLIVERNESDTGVIYKTRTSSHRNGREFFRLRRLNLLLPVKLDAAYDERGHIVSPGSQERVLIGNGTYFGRLEHGTDIVDRTTGFHAPKELYPQIDWISYSLYDGDQRPRLELGDDNNYVLRNFVSVDALADFRMPTIYVERPLSSAHSIKLRHSTLPNGFMSALVFTLHGCFNNAKLLQCLLFGDSGFKSTGIGCTISAFIDNSGCMRNNEAYGTDSTLGYAITSSSENLSLAHTIVREPSFELGLHCEDWVEFNDQKWKAAIEGFASEFGRLKTFIDHLWYKGHGEIAGPVKSCYNGSARVSGRLNDLYAIGARYFWNATREYIYTDPISFSASNYSIPNALQIGTHPDLAPDIISWYTDETFATNALIMETQTSKFVQWHSDRKDRFIHCYFGNANPMNGIWTMRNGAFVLKPQFAQMLNNLGLWQRSGETWTPTVAQYIEYQQKLRGIRYSLRDNSTLVIHNDSGTDIRGLTFVAEQGVSIVGGRLVKQRGEDVYWEIELINANSTVEFEVGHV